MNKLYTYLVITGILCISVTNLKATEPVMNWQIGEELTYKVSWAFIRLGTLKLCVNDTLYLHGKFVYDVSLRIDSNPDLFFIDIHSKYNSYLDRECNLHKSTSVENIDGEFIQKEYIFDFERKFIKRNTCFINQAERDNETIFPMNDKLYDGTSAIFYARAFVPYCLKDTVITVHNDNIGLMGFNFSGKKEIIEMDILNYTLESLYIDGQVDMQGIAGVTGAYKGWFSTDKQHIPLKAKLKVFVGNVNLELESHKNWKPTAIFSGR